MRLPTRLNEAVDAFEADEAVTAAFGPDLVASLLALRRSEIELFADASDEEIADALRWTH